MLTGCNICGHQPCAPKKRLERRRKTCISPPSPTTTDYLNAAYRLRGNVTVCLYGDSGARRSCQCTSLPPSQSFHLRPHKIVRAICERSAADRVPYASRGKPRYPPHAWRERLRRRSGRTTRGLSAQLLRLRSLAEGLRQDSAGTQSRLELG